MYLDLLDFWFSESMKPYWFNATTALDQQLRDEYAELWTQAKNAELESWGESALGSLALVILLDQLPLNMFRGTPESFSTEAQARLVAQVAIDRGFDLKLSVQQRSFLYLPFMHSESLQDQATSVRLFDQLGLEESYRFAQHHFAIVEAFGRFPHRNAILGRKSSAEEVEYLASKEAFRG